MNWFKWLECWWHRRHIYTIFYDRKQRAFWHCVRCGHETDLPTPCGHKVGSGETATKSLRDMTEEDFDEAHRVA